MESPSSISQTAEGYMRFHLDRYYEHLSQRQENNIPSLASIAADAQVQDLENQEDIEAATVRLAEQWDLQELRLVMENPKATYRLLRAFHELRIGGGRRAIDLDEAIRRNESYLRDRSNVDGKYLISLEKFVSMLSDVSTSKAEVVSFIRKDAPKGGLEVLDDLRKRNEQFLANSTSFSQTFNRISKNALRGLDWRNLVLVGDMVLATLLHTDPEEDDDETLRNIVLNIYIHGLDPSDANRKAAEIHDAWVANLPASAEKIVVKSPRVISLIPSYPHRRIQIVLQLTPSPTDILLKLDVDPCAMAFDGSSVLMLPRCARAIETGYITFTNDLIFGDYLSSRPATRGSRLFKYANRGFGVRFLPSFAKYLQSDQCSQREFALWADGRKHKIPLADEQRDRYPFGVSEPGLMTLKRIAYLGQDYVHRLVFGPTPLTTYPGVRDLNSGPDAIIRSGSLSWKDEQHWQGLIQEAREDWSMLTAYNDNARIRGKAFVGPRALENELADFRFDERVDRALDNFEIFSRFCEAWSRAARKEILFEYEQRFPREVHGFLPDTSGLWSFFTWDESLNLMRIEDSIDDYNNELFAIVQATIERRLDFHDWVNSDFRNYLTRRIRFHVYGPTFQAVQEKQITIPLLITQRLEDFLLRKVWEDYPDLPAASKPLIPLHDATKYDAATSNLPSLRDTTTEKGNLRYWVITNTSMWAGQHRVLDEMTEILWDLQSFYQAAQETNYPGLLSFFGFGPQYSRKKHTLLYPETRDKDRLDVLLFRQWVLPTPQPTMPVSLTSKRRGGITFHPLFNEEALRYPFPNDLFWNDGDEGEWDQGDGVPEWRTDPTKCSKRNTPAEEFFDPHGQRTSGSASGYWADVWNSPCLKGRMNLIY